MPVSRRPKQEDARGSAPVDVDALILKGGSVAQEAPRTPPAREKDLAPVVLRVPGPLLRRIDDALEARAVKIPRHTWLLEALVEKLGRESG